MVEQLFCARTARVKTVRHGLGLNQRRAWMPAGVTRVM
jgi:hypothetical protein